MSKVFKETWDQSGFWGSNLTKSRKIFGNKGDFGNFPSKHLKTDPLRGLAYNQWWFMEKGVF